MRKTLKLVSKILSVVLFMVACAVKVYAQSYPVQVNTSLIPPYSPFLADISEPGSQRFATTFLLRNLNVTEYKGKLRLTIEGVGITIRTKQNFIPINPITLYGGEALTLYGEDLSEYFNPNNLDFAGITRNQYEKGAKLPEGVYRFTIEMLDYNRGSLVSNKGTAVAWIILNDPPLLNLPKTDAKVKIIDPTNIAFSWSPRHTGSPNAAFSVEYIFKLVEIWPITRNPNDAMLSQQPLYEVTTDYTQIVYGPAEPALIAGRKYAWQVQAKDVEGRDLFKNQGKSEVYVFQYGDALGVPENFAKEGDNASLINLSWQPAQNGAIPQQYRIRYRKKGTEASGIWYEDVSNQLWIAIPNLKPETEYEMQIRAEAQPQYSDYSALQTIRTAKEGTAGYTCGANPVIKPVTNTNLLLTLAAGEVVIFHDFKLLITEVKGSNGNYTGSGWLKVPMLNGAGIKVNFSGQVNTNYELTGVFESAYHQGSPAAQRIDDANKIGEEPKQKSTKTDSTTTTVPDYTVKGTIDSVYVNDEGKIVVVDTEGKESTYEQKKDEKTGKIKETVVADAAGNTYTVGEDGKVTKASGGSSSNTNGAATVQADPIKDRIIVLILEQFEEEIGAWLRINGKGGEDDPEVLLALELPECFPQNENILGHINESTIPYFKEHPSELRGKIESDQSNKELFDKIAKPFKSAEDVTLNNVPENDQEAVNKITCSAISEADIDVLESEFTTQIGVNKKGSSCFMQGWNRGEELYGKYEAGIAIYAGILRFSLCEAEKENCGQDGGVAAYSCGLANGLLQELDWFFLLESEGITKEDIANVILCVKDSYPIGGNVEDNPEIPRLLFKCITGVALEDMGNAIKDFIVKNWDEPYYQGQATAFVLTLISPFKGKIVEKLATLPEYATKLSKFKSLSKAKNADELVVVAKSLANVVDDLAYANLGIKQAINLTSFAAQKSDSYIDVIVHFSNGKFKAIVEEGGSFIEKSVAIEQLATIMKQLPDSKSLRLLSCNDIASAKALSKQLPGRTLYASDGWVDLYADGVIKSENKFKKLANGEALAEVGMDGSSASTKKIRLGEEVVTDVSKRAQLLAKVDNLNAVNLKNWINRLDEIEDAALLKKINDLAANDPTKLAKLDGLYKNMKAPAGKKGTGNFTVKIEGIDVYYDKNGFPDFTSTTPRLKGKTLKYESKSLLGNANDMTGANNWGLKEFGADNFQKIPNSTKCKIKVDDKWIEHTWHHHQDGTTMFPVPSNIHSKALHSGGAAVIEGGLQGFFNSPLI